MTGDPFSALSHGGLFGAPAVLARLDETARIAAMVRVETALARAAAAEGVIPAPAGPAIEAALKDIVVDPASLARGTYEAGVPIPALVAELRRAVGPELAAYVHWGATSQDIIDTALCLVLKDVLAGFSADLDHLVRRLGEVAAIHRATLTLARTRMQQAAPTTFGLKVAGWREPLVRAQDRLGELTPRLLVVQFGGAAGTLAPLGARGIAVMERLAGQLGLGVPRLPWATQRDSLAELAGWLSLVTGSLGKIGLDVSLMAQSEIGELREATDPARGGSSTLPQKANPVLSEVLVALARYAANALSGFHQAMLAEYERSGAAWSLEWMVLPGMLNAAGAALAHARTIADDLVVDTQRMRANLAAAGGFELAEAASFALAGRMDRAAARNLVEAACAEAQASGRNLIDVLAAMSDAEIDWARLRDPGNYLGVAGELVDRALAARR